MIVRVAVVASLLSSFSVMSQGALSDAQRTLKLKLERREAELAGNLDKINALRTPQLRVKLSDFEKPPALDFGTEKLKCITSRFAWPIKNPNKEHKDCTFKMNIANPKEIKKLYATLQFMQTQGWDVSHNELHKQRIINDDQILNEERYRFVMRDH